MKLESKRIYLKDLKMEYFKCSKTRKGELHNEAESILKWSRKDIKLNESK